MKAKKRIVRRLILNMTMAFGLLSMLVLSACSDSGYMDAIPKESTLVLSMDPVEMSGTGNQTVLKTLLHVKNIDETGLDLSSKVFFFEDPQGNLGFCAHVDDGDKLADQLKKVGVQPEKKRDNQFALLPNNWLIGWSDQSALLMGPVIPTAAPEMMQLMGRYLKAEEDEGIRASQLFEKLDSIGGAMALVGQVAALPQQLVAPLTLGAPKDAAPSDIYLAAQLKKKDGVLWIDGTTFSFKKRIDKALQDAKKIYRPIKGDYAATMSDSDVMGMFMNVDGRQLIRQMQQNPALTAMLAAINGAIDLDNIIRGIDGDLAIITPQMAENRFQMQMAARMPRTPWLADVDYWKQSVPAGGRIGDWGKNCYYYTSDKTSYYFGVTADGQYMSGSSEKAALASIHPAKKPVSKGLMNGIKGRHSALVINMNAFGGDKAAAVTGMLRPMFGNVTTLVICQ